MEPVLVAMEPAVAMEPVVEPAVAMEPVVEPAVAMEPVVVSLAQRLAMEPVLVAAKSSLHRCMSCKTASGWRRRVAGRRPTCTKGCREP